MPSRRAVLGVLAGMLPGCAAPAADRTETRDVPTDVERRVTDAARRARRAVVVLQPRESADSGTAWFLADGHLVTAAHVVEALAGPLRVSTVAGRAGSATVESRWPAVDLALLTTDAPRPAGLPLGDEADVMDGEPVLQIGHTRVGYWSVTIGRVERVVERAHRSLVLTDLDMMRGNSGSPLITLEGDAIGMSVGTMPRPGVPPQESPTPGPIVLRDRYPRRSVRYGAHLAPSTLRRYLDLTPDR